MDYANAFACLSYVVGRVGGDAAHCYTWTPPDYWALVTNWTALAGVSYILIGIPLICGILIWFVSFIVSKAKRI